MRKSFLLALLSRVIKLFIFIAMFIFNCVATWAIIFILMNVFLSLLNGYSWEKMDWNQDGTTTLAEFFDAGDIGKTEVVVDGKLCSKYFTYKEGTSVKISCSSS